MTQTFGIMGEKGYICTKLTRLRRMTQLVITLKDQSYLPNIRRIVKSLQGVESVSTSRKQVTSTASKPASAIRRGNTISRKGKAMSAAGDTDPLEALESIGSLVRSTGRTPEHLIDEYLTEKYGV